MGKCFLRCFFLALFFSTLFANSPPDFSLASVYNEPSVFVEGKVNAITGELVDLEEDLVIQGAEPIRIHRVYLNTSRKDWIFVPQGNAVIDFSEGYQNCTIRESTGCPIRYKQVSNPKKHIYRYEPSNLEEGFSNTSSCASLKNNYALYNEKKHQLTLYTAEGIERIYERRKKKHDGNQGESWRLLSEHLPNGNWLLYDYIKTNQKYAGPIFALSSIRSTNPSKTKQYAEARFLHEDPKGKNKHFFIEGSDGQRLEYRFDIQYERQSGYLNAVVSDACRPHQFYEHCKHRDQTDYWHFEPDERMISAILYPQNRRLEVAYYFKFQEKVDGTKVVMNDKEIPKSNHQVDFTPDPRRGRVKKLSAPRGSEGQVVMVNSFFYDVENKKTTVYDAERNRIEYYYDDQLRIQRLERYAKSGSLLNVEQFEWAGCNLASRTLLDQDRKTIHAKKFSYDARSNLIQEKSIGNLSGKGSETYSKEWRYSEGTPSLLLESKTEDGFRIIYDYLPGTNLPTRQLTFADGKIVARQFWVYNDDHLLIREISDDGSSSDFSITSGITVRMIRDYLLRTEQPYLGMPETIEEKYWDGSNERLLQKTVLHYTKAGLIDHKDIYDSSGAFRYSLSTEYDSQGRPKNETNPLSWNAYSQFDEVGNRIYHRDFSGRAEIFTHYDTANRPTEKTFKGFDGLAETYKYNYNKLNFLTSEIDPQGHATTYTLTPFGQSVETRLPPLLNEAGIPAHPTLHADYDAAGNAIRRIDAENFATKITYNAYGSPLEITHPDQSKETYEYFRNGSIKSHTDQMGIVTAYERDPLGQIIRKTISQSGKVLAEEFFQYKGQRLIAKTDAEGHRTSYAYDGAGRKILEEFEGEKTVFQYDELGRNHITQKGKIQTWLQFDLLGRIEEMREEEIATGHWLRKIVYHYDTANHPIAIFHWVGKENLQVSETLNYDSLNRLTSRIDPLGNQTTIFYKEIFSAGKNLKILQKTDIDPMGLETIERLDTHGQIASVEKRKGDQSLFREQKFYNPRGLLALQINTISNPDGASRKVRTKWEYDAIGRPIKLIEAEGTPHAKITTYTYNLRGEKKTTTKPDGCVLTYDYNSFGALEFLASSDGTVRHQMRSNKLGTLIWADGNGRKLDGKGRLLSEDFANGLRIENSYHQNGQRATCAIAPADCLIEYGYNGLDLTEVSRKTLRGNTLYTHSYLGRDLSGNLLQSKLLNDLGTVQFSYDAYCRKITIDAPKFSQEVLAKDPLGNILQMKTGDQEISYTYDALSQITSERESLFNHDYQYDSLHCRLKKNDEAYEINPLHQIVSHIEYDKNGNPKRQGNALYTFDALDRLIRIETPDCIQTYQYDALNRRLSATTSDSNGQQIRYFLYDGQKEIGAFDENLTPIELRILGEAPHAEIGAAIALELRGKVYAPIHDVAGNTAILLPFDGSEPTRYRYSAFGEETIEGPTKSPWRFSSKRIDDTGLIYYGRRHYQPDLGRWLSPDPAGFIDGMNLYAFVHNNPLTHFDEYGLLDFGQYEPNYREATLATWSQLTTPIAHGLVTASEYMAYANMADGTFEAAFEQTRNNYINSISHTALQAHSWIDQNRLQIADFASKSTGAMLGSGIAMRSIAPLYQEAKLAIQAAKGARNASQSFSPAFDFKSTPIPEQIHRVNSVISIPQKKNDAMWHTISPFKNKSAVEIHEMFLKKEFAERGKDCVNGFGNYINLKNGRQYHIDPQKVGRYREPNHVDVSRLGENVNNLNKKKFRYLDD